MSAFTLSVPAGWVGLDAAAPDPALIRALSEQCLLGPTSGQGSSRLQLTLDHLRELSIQGKAVVYAPAAWVSASACRPVIAIGPLVWGAGVEPLPALLALADQDRSARMLTLPVAVGLRTRRTAPIPDGDLPAGRSDLDADARVRTSTIDPPTDGAAAYLREIFRYWIGLADQPASWIEALCVATIPNIPGSDDIAAHLQDSFDSLLSSYAWMP
ncbi:MAG: hypothetical protein V9G19_20125 [Tetrasphaera sp.]